MRAVSTRGLHDFDAWRAQARSLLIDGIPPDQIFWTMDSPQEDLFCEHGSATVLQQTNARHISIPRAFLRLAEAVLMHRDPSRFPLLYGLLWRILHRQLHLADAADTALRQAHIMAKAVGRDIHKMRAFVRFSEVEHNGVSCFIAWFEPDHMITRANADFFVRRFPNMDWAILTPNLCLHWDQVTLRESPGLEARPNQKSDPVEALWTQYYAATFNPARVKVAAMLKEMPRRYWKNMPETALIADLLAGASVREGEMLANSAEKVAY
jgi:uracil-DNA glycosylase